MLVIANNDLRVSIILFVLFLTALIVSSVSFKYVLKIAQIKDIVDKPGPRKIQSSPIALMGGLVVYIGTISSIFLSNIFFPSNQLFCIVAAFTIMLFVGTVDDVITLSPWQKFIVEILVVLTFIFSSGWSLDNLHGLWGVYQLPMYISIPLTIIAAVGIINAVNMIDGVNGLSSGFCITMCIIYSFVFFHIEDYPGAVLAVSTLGGLIPFILHNIFGLKSKMFLGDGGTLMIGMIFSAFIISFVHDGSIFSEHVAPNCGIVAFALSTLSIPVFDTLRVMTTRMLKGTSPFAPDKTHLHHLLMDLHFSHIGTTITIVSLNLLITLIWYLSYRLGVSINFQLYIVVICALLFTYVFYGLARYCERKNNIIYNILIKIGDRTHVGNTKFYLGLRKRLDKIVDKFDSQE